MVDPAKIPLRVAERAGRLLFWINQQQLAKRERDVALWLVTDGDGEYLDTRKSAEVIGADLGVSERTVRAALGGLEGKGLVTRTRRTNPDGSRTSDYTRLQVPPEVFKLRSSEVERNELVASDDLDPSEWAIQPEKSSGRATDALAAKDPGEPPAKSSGRVNGLAMRPEESSGRGAGDLTEEISEEPSSIANEIGREEGSPAESSVRPDLPLEFGRRPAGRRRLLRSAADVFAIGEAAS